ncbi:hypothetical protein PR048_015534 [Dryococelus australis]|uniref:Recombination activating protein 1 n=1 Tax=Dryococelus australis TaxID=614101 RepID=A0ABQ9HH73_9NEOP|nr:hypothetical protein PR048_015534 [Dryococelus australis]
MFLLHIKHGDLKDLLGGPSTEETKSTRLVACDRSRAFSFTKVTYLGIAANMSSSDEDVVSGYVYLHSRNKKRKRFWVHPDFEKQHEKRWFKIACEFEDPIKFKQIYKMSRESFCVLEGLVGP